MRIVFIGIFALGALSLRRLVDEGIEVCAVVTKPSGPGPGQPVADEAGSMGLPVYQPDSLRDQDLVDRIAACSPDLIVVAGYHLRVPPSLMAVPRLGCINTHLSMLPSYRGPVPHKWAIINGETSTGVTIHELTEQFDAGPIIAQRPSAILDGDTADSLFDRLSEQAADLLAATIRQMGSGHWRRVEQDESVASYHPNLTDADAKIDWASPIRSIDCLVRGLTPRPRAWFEDGGTRVRVHQVRALEGRSGRPPGTILARDGRDVHIAGNENDIVVRT